MHIILVLIRKLKNFGLLCGCAWDVAIITSVLGCLCFSDLELGMGGFLVWLSHPEL